MSLPEDAGRAPRTTPLQAAAAPGAPEGLDVPLGEPFGRPGPSLPVSEETWEACLTVLESVSRPYALDVRRLPAPMGRAVCVASLLGRLVDTLAGASGWSAAQKARSLHMLRRQLEGGHVIPGWHQAAATSLQGSYPPGELVVLRVLPSVLHAFDSLGPQERPVIARAINEKATGLAEMEEALEQHRQEVRLLPSLTSLHRYCHYIAGTWSTMMAELLFLHSPHVDKACFFALAQHAEPYAQMLARQRLLEGTPRSIAAGTCFVPRELLRAHGLTPATLLAPARRDAALRTLTPLLTALLSHLPAAWRYLTLVPVQERAVRLSMATGFFLSLHGLRGVLVDPLRLLGAGGAVQPGREETAALLAQLEQQVDHPALLHKAFRSLLADCRSRCTPTLFAEVARALDAAA